PGGVYTTALRVTPTVLESYETVSILPRAISVRCTSNPSGAIFTFCAFEAAHTSTAPKIKMSFFIICLYILMALRFNASQQPYHAYKDAFSQHKNFKMNPYVPTISFRAKPFCTAIILASAFKPYFSIHCPGLPDSPNLSSTATYSCGAGNS